LRRFRGRDPHMHISSLFLILPILYRRWVGLFGKRGGGVDLWGGGTPRKLSPAKVTSGGGGNNKKRVFLSFFSSRERFRLKGTGGTGLPGGGGIQTAPKTPKGSCRTAAGTDLATLLNLKEKRTPPRSSGRVGFGGKLVDGAVTAPRAGPRGGGDRKPRDLTGVGGRGGGGWGKGGEHFRKVPPPVTNVEGEEICVPAGGICSPLA